MSANDSATTDARDQELIPRADDALAVSGGNSRSHANIAATNGDGHAAVSMATIQPDAAHLAAMAEFAAGAGHEINNPLGAIVGHAQRLLKTEADPLRRKSLAAIVQQAWRIRDMIGDAMLFASPPAIRPEAVLLNQWLPPLVERWNQHAETGSTPIELTFAARELTVWATPEQLAVVVHELWRNAAQALASLETPPPIELVVSQEDQQVTFFFRDHGVGFSEVERKHAFDPFYSGRQAGRGLGFGLCKVWRIVTNHGGQVSITAQPGTTEVTVVWPMPPR